MNTTLLRTTNNLTNASYIEDTQIVSRSALTFWCSVGLTLCMFGAVCNASLLAVIVRSRKLRSGTGLLILHLIVTCLFACLVNCPILLLLAYGNNYWFHVPQSACNYVNFFLFINQYASNWSEAWLGINRFIATVFPHQYHAWTRPKVCLVMMTFCWVFTGATILPFCLGIGGIFLLTPQGQCITVFGQGMIGRWLLSFNAFTPYVVVGVATFAILGKICQRQFSARHARVHNSGTSTIVSVKALRRRVLFRKQLNMAGVFFLVFLFCIVCNVPLSLLVSFKQGAELYARLPLLRLWMRIFTVCQYAFTPVIFFLCNADYRVGFMKLIGRIDVSDNLRTNTVDPQGGLGESFSPSLPAKKDDKTPSS